MCSAAIFLNPISSYPSAPDIFPPKLHNFQPKFNLCVLPLKKMSSLGGFDFKTSASGNYDALSDDCGIVALREYIGKGGENVGDELGVLFSRLEYACKRIAALVASPFNSTLGKKFGAVGGSDDRDKPKPLDIVANDIILSSLRKFGKVSVMASEEDDAPVWLADDGPFVIVLDPLDGSRNIDASIPTGTIFGKICSVNDARFFDWPVGLRRFIDTVRQGKGQPPVHISLVADFHRTLLYGGLLMNLRDHLRLLYEADPLSFLAEQAGGKGSDGKG